MIENTEQRTFPVWKRLLSAICALLVSIILGFGIILLFAYTLNVLVT